MEIDSIIHRASDDGYSALSFHENCNDKFPTITVIKTEKNYVFGGYTTQRWKSRFHKACDNSAFIFSLRNGEDSENIQKYGIQRNGTAITCRSNQGPTFGKDDIVIKNECYKFKSSINCNSNGTAYNLNKSLAEKSEFIVKDYEVFQLIKWYDYIYHFVHFRHI